MRKLIDTLVLVVLLVGPAVVLTCVGEPDTTNVKMSKADLPSNRLELALAYDASSAVYTELRP
jgi:hypothetical protein